MEEELDTERRNVLNRYAFKKDNDARVTIFSKVILAQRSCRLCFIFIRNHLTEQDWWKALRDDINWTLPLANKALDDLLDHYIAEFEDFLTIGYVHTLFSSIESSFRIFTRALDPNACHKGTDDFMNIYQWLLTKLNLWNYLCMLHLLRLMRNTIHNNGVYYHRKNLKEIVSYNGKTYTFEQGKGVEYGDVWKLLQFQIMPDIKRMMTQMVNTKDISSIPQILDPFIKVQWL